MFRNNEGYADPTAGMEMSRIMKEYRQKQKKCYAGKNCIKVYVASMYADDTETNTRRLSHTACRRVIAAGDMPVASHLLYPKMLDDNDPEERNLGMMFGLALLKLWRRGVVSDPYPPAWRGRLRMQRTLTRNSDILRRWTHECHNDRCARFPL